jgi:SAM-dependent methyltransferase
MVALDTIEMATLLPDFLARVGEQHLQSDEAGQTAFKLVDLGCGTGRNTLQLLALAPPSAKIVGLDVSPGMLAVAQQRIDQFFAAKKKNNGLDETVHPQKSNVILGVYDMLAPPATAQPETQDPGHQILGSSSEIPPVATQAAGVISTLVLEHVPSQVFFRTAASMLRPGGHLLVTNMHADMGRLSQAGFVEVKTGKKIRPTSYNHEVDDVVQAAADEGF